MSLPVYTFHQNQNPKKKFRVDTLLLELIIVVGIVYGLYYVSFQINLKKALKFYDAGEYEQAIDKLSHIAPMTATDPAIYYRLAVSHAKLGQHDLAIPYY